MEFRQKLEQERDRYRAALESEGGVLFEYDVTTNCFLSVENVAMQGYQSGPGRNGERFPLPPSVIIHAEDLPRAMELLTGRSQKPVQLRMHMPGETENRWFTVSGNILQTDDGSPHMVGILRDITEVRSLQDQKTFWERIFQFTVQQDYNMVASLEVPSFQFSIHFSNMSSKYRLSKSGSYEDSLYEVGRAAIHPDDRRLFLQELGVEELREIARQPGAEKRHFCRFLAEDGTYRWKQIRFIYFEQVSQFLFTVQDVHEFQEIQSRERIATQMFAAAFRDIYDQIYELLPASDEYFEIFCERDGVSRRPGSQPLHELIGSNIAAMVHPDHQSRCLAELEQSTLIQRLSRTLKLYFEVLLGREGGENGYHWFSFYLQLMPAAGEDHVILYLRNVDEIRRERENNQRALQDALMLAREANRAKSDFISRMSHDIRTPMNAIIGMTAIAQTNLGTPEKVADCLGKIDVSAKFLLSLINDILDMSKIESGKIVIARSPFDFQGMIRGLGVMFTPQAAQRQLTFRIEMEEHLPAHFVGDELRINQILMNLLGNAVKFTTPGGQVTLRVSRERARDDVTLVRFEVEDTGIGISKEFQERIFDPFEREGPAPGGSLEGTGLGMTITKNLVQLMGGQIFLESELGKGTRFIVELPLEVEEDGVLTPVSESTFCAMRVLIADDDIITCEHTQQMLRQLGIGSTAWVTSGEQLLQEIRESQDRDEAYDVVLLDWKMPDMDGLETAKALRDLFSSEMRVVLMSACDWSEIEEAARSVGVKYFLSKPLFPQQLQTVLVNLIQERPVKAAPREIRFSGERVLLVEDNEINLEIAQTFLEMRGLRVDTAQNGQEALDRMAHSEPGAYQVILMDIRMPVMDGIAATRAIRALDHPDAGQIPIVAMTANAFQEDAAHASQIGMNGYLTKPIEPERLYQTLDQLLHHGREKPV